MNNPISIIIPVLNEANVIHRTLQQFSCASPDTPPHEIIVVDGDSAGETISTIIDPTVKTAIAPKGRGLQMNRGASLASGEILLFLHADTLLPANSLSRISAALANTSAAWGAFELGIASSRSAYRLIETVVRIRTGAFRFPYGDQAMFMTKDLFQRVGGYPQIPIMEDVALVRRIKKQGAAMCIIQEKVSTSPRRWETEGLVFSTLRNWFLIICYFLGARPEILAKYYRSKGVDKFPETF